MYAALATPFGRRALRAGLSKNGVAAPAAPTIFNNDLYLPAAHMTPDRIELHAREHGQWRARQPDERRGRRRTTRAPNTCIGGQSTVLGASRSSVVRLLLQNTLFFQTNAPRQLFDVSILYTIEKLNDHIEYAWPNASYTLHLRNGPRTPAIYPSSLTQISYPTNPELMFKYKRQQGSNVQHYRFDRT